MLFFLKERGLNAIGESILKHRGKVLSPFGTVAQKLNSPPLSGGDGHVGFVPPPKIRRGNNIFHSRSESTPLGRRGWERKPTVFFPKRSFSFDWLGGG
jgi:hypothetical protein